MSSPLSHAAPICYGAHARRDYAARLLLCDRFAASCPTPAKYWFLGGVRSPEEIRLSLMFSRPGRRLRAKNIISINGGPSIVCVFVTTELSRFSKIPKSVELWARLDKGHPPRGSLNFLDCYTRLSETGEAFVSLARTCQCLRWGRRRPERMKAA